MSEPVLPDDPALPHQPALPDPALPDPALPDAPLLPASPPAALGGLGPAVLRLTTVQRAWPPRRPARVVRPGPAHGLEEGAAVADALVDEGADLVVVPGGGPTGPALAALAVLLDLEPVGAVGTTAVPGWAALVGQVRDGLRAGRDSRGDPARLLEVLEATELAGLTGTITRCVARRTPVLLSGAADVWAAALLAERRTPGTWTGLLAGCSPPPGAAALARAELGLAPVLDLHLAAPEGAELALGVLLGGIDLLHAQLAVAQAGPGPGGPPGA